MKICIYESTFWMALFISLVKEHKAYARTNNIHNAKMKRSWRLKMRRTSLLNPEDIQIVFKSREYLLAKWTMLQLEQSPELAIVEQQVKEWFESESDFH